MEKDVRVLKSREFPSEFCERMRRQLGGDYDSFEESFRNPPRQGLRANRTKISREALKDLLPFPVEPVRWCRDGFYFPLGERPAKLAEYSAGLFYIQEPSAMLPAALLDVQPGERVLDLCAAPGGKSVQMAGDLIYSLLGSAKSTLVANDVSASRSRALVKNLELAGVTNAAVFNEQPSRLAERFPHFFDRILVDAPCSGEGMFRRDPDAAKSWEFNKPQACAAMQREILRHASAMLAPGGRMVYSTCTFSEIENEDMIEAFLDAHKNFKLVPVDAEEYGCVPGKLPGTVRIWPHLTDGEGHFAALLEKLPSGEEKSRGAGASAVRQAPEVFTQFCREYLPSSTEDALLEGSFATNGISVYRVPKGLPDTRGLRIARSGWYMGDVSKGRFTPSQALAMGLRECNANVTAGLDRDAAARYLKGEIITPEASALSGGGLLNKKPWVLVCFGSFPLGWARLVGGRLKNRLPPGWVNP